MSSCWTDPNWAGRTLSGRKQKNHCWQTMFLIWFVSMLTNTFFLWFNWDVQRRIILLISPASFATSWQYASVAGWTVPKSPSSAEICDKKLPNLRLCEWVEVVQLSAGSKQKIGIPILVFLCDHVAQNVNPVTLAVPHVVLICHCMLESWIVSLAVGQNVKKSVQTKN